jgi:16S rRNA (adenine1518-N6/adenine1519-N6)-dimethyltransferase
MPENLAHEAKSLLLKLGFSPRKKLGQNFMTDAPTLEFIAGLLSLKKGESALEIGPGLGFLTRFLLKTGAGVIAVEKDPGFAKFLKDHFAAENFAVLEKDILELDFEKDLPGRTPIKVAGNIPYNITSPILEWLITNRGAVSEAALTMQWEVAERLKASCGTKTWGALSIFVQVYAQVQIAKKIPRGSFFPEPSVDSAAVKLTFPKTPLFEIKNEKNFFFLVRKAFQKRRKTVLNALTDPNVARLEKTCVQSALKTCGIDLVRRPETLTIAEWVILSNQIQTSGSGKLY